MCITRSPDAHESNHEKRIYVLLFIALCVIGICILMNDHDINGSIWIQSNDGEGTKDNINNIDCDEWIMVLITSCGRWELLSQTIESFETYNTYKCIKNKVVMDDCNDMIGIKEMEIKYKHYGYSFYLTTTPRNTTYLNHRSETAIRVMFAMHEGLTKYYINDTDNTQYVFIIEDDWKLYEKRFIEDSLSVYNNHEKIGNPQSKISYLTLRNMQIHGIYVKGRQLCGGTFPYSNKSKIYNVSGSNLKYILSPSGNCYAHYNNHPGLKEINVLINHIELCLQRLKEWGFIRSMEHCVGCMYRKYRFIRAHIVYPDVAGYVGHIGGGQHVIQNWTEWNIKKRMLSLEGTIQVNHQYLMNLTNCKYIPINKSAKSIFAW